MPKALAWTTCLLLLTASLGLSAPARAAQGGRGGVGSQGVQLGAPGDGQLWAVLVGVSRYEDPRITTLECSVQDAEALARVLVDPQYGGFQPDHVHLLTSRATDPNLLPTRYNILSEVEFFLGQAGPKDTVWLYFSGHGMEEEGHGYLLSEDAKIAGVRYSAVPLKDINDLLEDNRAACKLVVLDACYSGTGKGVTMGDSFNQEAHPATAEGRVTLASCKAHQESYEWSEKSRSVFTYYLVEGLQGAADSDRDGVVTHTEAYDYVYDKVRGWAAERRQHQEPNIQSNIAGRIRLASVPAAMLRVSSKPAGARVLVKDGPEGVSPCEVPVNLGAGGAREVEVRLEKDGYKTATRRVKLEPGKKSRLDDVQLVPLEPAPSPSLRDPMGQAQEAEGQGEHRAAVGLYQGALRSGNLAPEDYVRANYHIGKCQEHLQDAPSAVEAYREALWQYDLRGRPKAADGDRQQCRQAIERLVPGAATLTITTSGSAGEASFTLEPADAAAPDVVRTIRDAEAGRTIYGLPAGRYQATVSSPDGSMMGWQVISLKASQTLKETVPMQPPCLLYLRTNVEGAEATITCDNGVVVRAPVDPGEPIPCPVGAREITVSAEGRTAERRPIQFTTAGDRAWLPLIAFR